MPQCVTPPPPPSPTGAVHTCVLCRKHGPIRTQKTNSKGQGTNHIHADEFFSSYMMWSFTREKNQLAKVWYI